MTDAATQMAVDEALFLSYQQGEALPTLRFYGWDPPAVSIGKNQRFVGEISEESCRRLNIAWVRRPTGGRAVLHEAELTYALIFGDGDGCGHTILESYFVIAKGLLTGLRKLGIAAQMYSGQAENHAGLNTACFVAPSWHELTVNGKKLVGSAQLRQSGAVLQHGSLLTDFNPGRLLEVLGRTPNSSLCSALDARVTSCREIIGRLIDPKELIPALTEGLSQAMGIAFTPGELTPKEWETVNNLRKLKYAAAGWNEGGVRMGRGSF